MLNKKFVMGCATGFHLRPAQVMMEAMTPFAADVKMIKESREEADAKSILALMTLGIEHGEAVEVIADGADEAEAMAAVEKLFETNFGE